MDPAELKRLLVLSAGDVEENPGPPRWPCGYCREAVTSKDWSIYCVDCGHYVHRKFAKMTIAEIRALNSFRWHCGCYTLKKTPPPAHRTTAGKKNVRILQCNVNEWRGRSAILKKKTEDWNIDVLVLQETKMTSEAVNLLPIDWNVFRRDRKV